MVNIRKVALFPTIFLEAVLITLSSLNQDLNHMEVK